MKRVKSFFQSVYMDLVPIDLKNCIITIKDGSSHSIVVKIGEGNLTYTRHQNLQYYLDRGLLDTVRKGDQQPVDVKMDASWLEVTANSGEPPSIEDALTQSGLASAWVSTGATCEPYAVDIVVTNNPHCQGDSEIITFPDFRYETLEHDIKAGTLACTGKCNVTQPTAVHAAAS